MTIRLNHIITTDTNITSEDPYLDSVIKEFIQIRFSHLKSRVFSNKIDLSVYKEFKDEDFSYLEDKELPILVLAYKINLFDSYGFTYYYEPKMKEIEGVEWKKISHQTAGVGCHQKYMIARILKPTEHCNKLMQDIQKKYSIDPQTYMDYSEDGHKCLGVFPTNLDDLVEYREILDNYGLDCNTSFRDLEEGIYPIDLTDEAVKILTDDEVPSRENLQKSYLMQEENIKAGGVRLFSDILGASWRLYILDVNCD